MNNKKTMLNKIKNATTLDELKKIKIDNVRLFKDTKSAAAKAMAARVLEIKGAEITGTTVIEEAEVVNSTKAKSGLEVNGEAANPDPEAIKTTSSINSDAIAETVTADLIDEEVILKFGLTTNPSKDLTARYNDIMSCKSSDEIHTTTVNAFNKYTEKQRVALYNKCNKTQIAA